MAERTTRAGVTVVGEALIDVVSRNGTIERTPGGSPFNVARALGRLGARAELVTQLGADADGDTLRRELEEAGVEVHAERVPTTARAEAAIGDDGAATYSFLIDWSLGRTDLAPRAVLHTGSIAAFLEPGATAVRELVGRRPDALVSFDPNIRPALLPDRERALESVAWFASHADLVKLSDEDAAWLWPGSTADDVEARLLDLGVGTVAVTLGGRGSRIATRTASVEIAAPQVRVADTIGAGDAWMAGLLAAIADRAAMGAIRRGTADETLLSEIGRVAAFTAALTVARTGARTPLRPELEAALAGSPGPPAPTSASAAAETPTGGSTGGAGGAAAIG